MPILELPRLAVSTVAATVAEAGLILANRDPAPEEVGVPLSWPVALELIDPGTIGIDRAATRIWVNDTLAFDGSSTGGILSGFKGPRAVVGETADTLRIVLDPNVPFSSQEVVHVRAVSATYGGAHSLDETYRFAVEDRTAPVVVAAQATGPRSLRIGFDEPVVVVDPSGFIFKALDVPAAPISANTATSDGNTVEIRLDTEMTPDARYRVMVTGVTDASGNAVSAPGDTAEFVGFRPARPEKRRFDLWSMLPQHNRREDTTGDLRRFISCLQEVTDLLMAEVDQFSDIFDIERAPGPFLDLLLHDLGNPFRLDLDELSKRRLSSVLVEMYRQKGTAIGIKNAVRFFLGLNVEILPFAADTMILGESELGENWILGPSHRFALYAFHVRVNQALSESQHRQLRTIVEYLKPAHTHLVEILQPSAPPSFDHWELGVSELGFSTLLH